MKISEKQKQIIETKERYVVVNASAASGKTATLTERIKFLLKEGINPKEIVVITFTNAAADEIRERVKNGRGVFIGTIHSYANFLLKIQGYDTDNYLNEENFDKLFTEVKQHQNCIQKVSYLLLDEGQDTTEQQFEFLFEMVAPENWIIFSDHKQSIYRWNGANPQYIIDLINRNDVKTYDLNENYRNKNEILKFAKSIIRLNGYDYIDKSIAMRGTGGKLIEVVYSPQAIAKGIKKIGNYEDWFILTRTNQQITDICKALQNEDIPYAIIKKRGMTNQEISKKLREKNVKVMTIHMSKGLECKNVVVIGAKFFNQEEKCISYVAATRAKDMLIWARQKTTRKKQDFEIWE